MGESTPVLGNVDDDPMCMLTTVSVSSHVCHNRSQYCVWTLGRSSDGGDSLNAMACEPFAAQRRTSSTASSTSHSGMSVSGINRPLPAPPHHSLIIQSLYALTHNSARSLSLASRNVCPQNRENEGKQSEASTWLISIASSRALWV